MISIAPAGARVAVISGQIGRRPNEPDGGDPIVECRHAFEQVRLACEAIGATVWDIVHLRTLLVDRANLAAFATARSTAFEQWYGDGAPPSSTLSFVVGLADADAICEIEALVAVP